jgi:hypothetical protein
VCAGRRAKSKVGIIFEGDHDKRVCCTEAGKTPLRPLKVLLQPSLSSILDSLLTFAFLANQINVAVIHIQI